MTQEQLRQDIQDVLAVELPPDADRQAFPGIFVDDGQHVERLAIMGTVLDEVVGPDVVAMCRS